MSPTSDLTVMRDARRAMTETLAGAHDGQMLDRCAALNADGSRPLMTPCRTKPDSQWNPRYANVTSSVLATLGPWNQRTGFALRA